MTKALKVVMMVIGIILILLGLANILIPEQLAEMHGLAESSGFSKWVMAVFGATFVAIGVWAIAAGRDPLRNIYLVKLLITLSILLLVINVYSIIQGYIGFSEVVPNIIVDAVFAVALLALYPWRAAYTGE